MQIQEYPRYVMGARGAERKPRLRTSYLDVFMHANSHLFAIIFEQMCFYADLFLLLHVHYE